MINPMTNTARRALALLDLTELGDHATEDDVTALCAKATSSYGNVAAVCVWPRHVTHARTLLAGTGVKVATVVNFPAGTDDADDVAAQTRSAIAAGADEIDVVLPWQAFAAGDTAYARAVLDATRAACAGHTLKVICETGELAQPDLIRSAAELAISCGADFIKTSTGKTANSASLDAATTMLDVIAHTDRPVGLKPSGGIRTIDDAAAYLDAADTIMGESWATPDTFRFGASGLWSALVAHIDGAGAVADNTAY